MLRKTFNLRRELVIAMLKRDHRAMDLLGLLMAKNHDFPAWLQVVAAYLPIVASAWVFLIRSAKRSAVMQHRVEALESDSSAFRSEFREIRDSLEEINSTVSSSEGKLDTLLAFLPRS